MNRGRPTQQCSVQQAAEVHRLLPGDQHVVWRSLEAYLRYGPEGWAFRLSLRRSANHVPAFETFTSRPSSGHLPEGLIRGQLSIKPEPTYAINLCACHPSRPPPRRKTYSGPPARRRSLGPSVVRSHLMPHAVAAASTPAAAEHPVRAALLLGALGVVFGDIGTSPIYAFRELIKAAAHVATETTVLGVLSMVFWAVVLIVAVKYVTFVMRADNQGEGGTMSLLSLALPTAGRLHDSLLVLGLGGAALFFGDAMITPAISVLSAIEGLEIAIPALGPYVVPIAAVVLIAVFAI